MKKFFTNNPWLLPSLLFLLVGFFLGDSHFFGLKKKVLSHGGDRPMEGKAWRGGGGGGGGELTNPLLECEESEGLFQILPPFDEDLGKLIEKLKREKKASEIAAYYRDLNNGVWIGFNEDAKFVPASLLKLPLMMAYFKAAESDPEIMTRKYALDAAADIHSFPGQNFPPEQIIRPGDFYPVRDLIQYMIRDSDNEAMYLLFEGLEKDKLNKVYDDLSVPIPTGDESSAVITVRDYARFFRILFNASYLTRQSSEEALGLLTQARFADGLRAGVPERIKIAHKFGERQLENNTSEQLHDCGIVYYPKHPYLLCVMTQGSDTKTLAPVIANISKFVYEQVDAKFKDADE
jgi:beta-lactamase class A